MKLSLACADQQIQHLVEENSRLTSTVTQLEARADSAGEETIRVLEGTTDNLFRPVGQQASRANETLVKLLEKRD